MRKSLIDIINILGIIAVIAVVIFAVYSLFIDRPFFEPSSYWFSGNGNMDGDENFESYTTDGPVDKIYVKNVSGKITAEGWNGDYVQLDYKTFGPGKPPEVKIDLSDSVLTIRTVYSKPSGVFGSVDFHLKIPENTEYVEAISVSGGVEISGLGPRTDQKLSSTSGSITTDGSGNLDISSVSGALDFISTGENISASTTSGRIEGVLEQAPSYGKIDISSVSGRVVLEVPSGLNADVNLHSVSGSVSCELPVSVTETRRNTIKGVIGSGGTGLEISTVSGAIKITE